MKNLPMILAFVGLLIAAAVALKINDDANASSNDLQPAAVIEIADQTTTSTTTIGTTSEQDGSALPAMTGDECAAAGAAQGWSATWGPGSDGCWIVSPDGSQVVHLGTWKE